MNEEITQSPDLKGTSIYKQEDTLSSAGNVHLGANISTEELTLPSNSENFVQSNKYKAEHDSELQTSAVDLCKSAVVVDTDLHSLPGAFTHPIDCNQFNPPSRYNTRSHRRRGRPRLKPYTENYIPSCTLSYNHNFQISDDKPLFHPSHQLSQNLHSESGNKVERNFKDINYKVQVESSLYLQHPSNSSINTVNNFEGDKAEMVGKGEKGKGERKKLVEAMPPQFASLDVSGKIKDDSFKRERRASRMGRPPKSRKFFPLENPPRHPFDTVPAYISSGSHVTQAFKKVRKGRLGETPSPQPVSKPLQTAMEPISGSEKLSEEDSTEILDMHETADLVDPPRRKFGRPRRNFASTPAEFSEVSSQQENVLKNMRGIRGLRRGRSRGRGRAGSLSPTIGRESPLSESSQDSFGLKTRRQPKNQEEHSDSESSSTQPQQKGRVRPREAPQFFRGVGAVRRSRGGRPVADRSYSRQSIAPVNSEIEETPEFSQVQESPIEELRSKKIGRPPKRMEDAQSIPMNADSPAGSIGGQSTSSTNPSKKKKKKHFKGLKYSFGKKKKKPKLKSQGQLDNSQETESVASEDVDADSFDSSSQDLSRRLLLLPGELDPYDPSAEFDDSQSEKSIPMSLQQQRRVFQRKSKEEEIAKVEEYIEDQDLEDDETTDWGLYNQENEENTEDFEEEGIQILENVEDEMVQENEDNNQENEDEDEVQENEVGVKEDEDAQENENEISQEEVTEYGNEGEFNEDENYEEEIQDDLYEGQYDVENQDNNNEYPNNEDISEAVNEHDENESYTEDQEQNYDEQACEETGEQEQLYENEEQGYEETEDQEQVYEEQEHIYEEQDQTYDEQEHSETYDEHEQNHGYEEQEEQVYDEQDQVYEEQELAYEEQEQTYEEQEEQTYESLEHAYEENEMPAAPDQEVEVSEENVGEGKNEQVKNDKLYNSEDENNIEECEGIEENLSSGDYIEEMNNAKEKRENQKNKHEMIDGNQERIVPLKPELNNILPMEVDKHIMDTDWKEITTKLKHPLEENENDECSYGDGKLKAEVKICMNGDTHDFVGFCNGERRVGSHKRCLEEPGDKSEDGVRKSKRISRIGPSHPLAIAAPLSLSADTDAKNEQIEEPVSNPTLTNVLCKCRVKKNPKAVNLCGEIYCQALDSFDGRIIGCCNTLTNHRYLRVSGKIPYMLLCNIHRQRIRRHNCCPGCGLFCTQGIFLECRWDKLGPRHYYHRLCGLLINGMTLCPHCGTDQIAMEVHLELKLSRKPIVYLKQHQEKKGFNSSARMSLSKTLLVETDSVAPSEEEPRDLNSLELPDGKVIFPSKLPVGLDRDRLVAAITVIKEGKQINVKPAPKGIYWSCKQGDLEKLLHVLVNGVSPNAKVKEYGNQCGLHTASTHGNLPAVHILVSAGAALDLIDSQLQAPLMIAIIKNHNDIVNYLIQAGANLNVKTQDGMTCLHLAAKSGNYLACRYILDSGRLSRHAINIQDEGGWTPLVWASENRCINVVKILLDRGANPQICDVEQNTALHWAAFSGSTHICSMVLDRGCSLRSMNAIGDTPLHIAARQNHVEAVVLLLARGAQVDIQNMKGQTPLDCAFQDSDVSLQLTLNKKLRSVMKENGFRNEIILSSDIAAGKEAVPIPIVNGADDEGLPKDHIYVSENCEALNVNIDRTMNSLKWCDCEDGCSSENCICSQLNFQCWYNSEGKLLLDFNYADPPMIFECNRACGCNKLSCHNRVVQHGMSCHLQLFKSKGKGWGVRALKKIEKGSYVCEYVGEIITDLEADLREDDSYLFDLDNRDSETFCIDARQYGNVARFINHLCEANLTPVKIFIDHQDLVFPRIAFFANKDIEADEELGFDYGEKFWMIKYKHFTCTCESPKCKYSSETIQTTLENYNKKMKEHQLQEKVLENGDVLSLI